MAKTVYLLQHTKDCNDELRKLIETGDEFKVAGSSDKAEDAIPQIFGLSPDFLITELVLAGSDGISVIRRVREKLPETKIIVLSALMREEIVVRAMDSGADYFMAKPVSAELLKERMCELAGKPTVSALTSEVVKSKNTISIDEKISRIFINVGIPPHIKGYSFLREGVKMAVVDPAIINNITKQLYPKIGEKYQTTASKVERAIRHAIEVAWNRGRIDNINNILGVRAYMGAEKPTNSEFIALVADKMILEKA